MIKIVDGKKIAVLENDLPVARMEEMLRITSVFVDYVKREIKTIFHWGFIDGEGVLQYLIQKTYI